ncbi:MAG TPA: geranylgeranylglyceryl/heptaprenylglyceryl phosphate synthase [Cytophagaceae bacterium]|jgi:phosphoglycerol geranylgeranyltransferase|nr:geranylgeranylglyceryl/heptaprenylglyceryl phosphate synthase [Cytophagaceae bacterium]
MKSIYTSLQEKKLKKQKSFAVLLDPDKLDESACKRMVKLGVENKIDYFFVGGSLLTDDSLSRTIAIVKAESAIPVVIFPGSNTQICNEADAILLLSLISGRNADALIGQHVIAAPILKQSGLEILSTGYMLVDCGKQTTVSYISNTTPIPHDKPAIAACTAMAGEMLGLKLIYLDGGSGALNPVGTDMIRLVRKSVEAPIIVGGGINTREKAYNALMAGADLIVVGNGIEKNPELLSEVSSIVHEINMAKIGRDAL